LELKDKGESEKHDQRLIKVSMQQAMSSLHSWLEQDYLIENTLGEGKERVGSFQRYFVSDITRGFAQKNDDHIGKDRKLARPDILPSFTAEEG